MRNENSCHFPPWTKTLGEIRESLNTSDEGLSHAEAEKRLREFGPNRLSIKKKKYFGDLVKRFTNPLVLVLLIASAISAGLGETFNFVIISFLILFSILLDFFQSYKAEKSTELLQKSVELATRVIRSKQEISIAVGEVVPGDIVLISAGDIVPADCRLLEVKDLFVNQALFTGESMPVEKKFSPNLQSHTNLEEAYSTLFMGTSILSGSAKAIVCATSSQTAMAQISSQLDHRPPPTAFDEGLKSFGSLILKLTVIMVLFVLFVNIVQHKTLIDSFLFAIALAVGLTPELLPMIVTITLARGAQQMAQREVIVKRLSSINNLGSMNIFCTDKTGTLTEGAIQLEKHIDGFGENDELVLELAFLNSFFETGLKSPLDKAILDHREINPSGWTKLDEIPFDFERRRISVLLEKEAERYLIVKGAAEEILALSTFYKTQLRTQLKTSNFHYGYEEFNDATRDKFNNQLQELESSGFRVLGIGFRPAPTNQFQAHLGDEHGLVFAGFAAFLDPPKLSAKTTLKKFIENGIGIKIITGDSGLITRYLFRHLEIKIIGELTGHQIDEMDEVTLSQKSLTCNLFCRTNPSQKTRIIQALKRTGNTIGYMGDGINDAGALHVADVGISVDNAAPVARESADIILLKKDLNVLIEGIYEGRKTFGNILKYIQMGTSSNFGNMISMAAASLFLPFLPMLPSQILLNNLLYDLSEIPIPFDRVDTPFLKAPRKWDMVSVQRFMLSIGTISSIFDIILFYLLISLFNFDETHFRSAWFLESIATQTLVIFLIRTQFHPWKSRPHSSLIITVIGILTFAIALPFTAFGNNWFQLSPLPTHAYLLIISITVIYLYVVESVKTRFFQFEH